MTDKRTHPLPGVHMSERELAETLPAQRNAFRSPVPTQVVSNGEYGVPKGLVFSYPCVSDGKGNLKVVEGVKLDAFGQQKFQTTLKELEEEREAVKSQNLLGG